MIEFLQPVRMIMGSLLLLCTMLLSGSAYGQVWKDALVMRTEGDTLKGQIQFLDADISGSSLTYRASSVSVVTEFNPDLVSSFKLLDPPRYFEALKAKIDYYSNGPIKDGTNPIIRQVPINVFAEVILNSQGVTLYSVFDDNKAERFFIRKAGKLTELKNIAYEVDREGRTFTMKNPAYRGQLQALLSDCFVTIGILGYNVREIIRVLKSYLECSNGTISFEQKHPADILNLGIFGAYGFVKGRDETHGYASFFGGSLQWLGRKNFNNRFLWIEAGALQIRPSYLTFGCFAGTYIGTRSLQPLVNVGLFSGPSLNVGGGIAYKKKAVLVANTYFGFSGQIGLLLKFCLFPRFKYH